MSEIIPYLASALIGVSTASITGYVITKFAIKRAKTEIFTLLPTVLDEIFVYLPKIVEKDEIKQSVGKLGYYLGAGAMQSVGMSQPKQPKGLMGLISQFAPMFLKQVPQGQPATTTEGVNPFNVT